jgi:hypothetical protein
MGTGTFRRSLVLAALILGLAGCGAAAGGGTARSGSVRNGSGASGAFSWIRPQAPPSSWKVAAIAGGAAIAYPPNWKPQHGDAGTATIALTGADEDHILGYLNLTPRQGSETLANWSSFRVGHNGDEGDKNIKRLAVGTGLHFRDASGSCVKDSYSTISHERFIEIACLVSGRGGEVVVVAAAPPESWASESGTLERAIEGIRT